MMYRVSCAAVICGLLLVMPSQLRAAEDRTDELVREALSMDSHPREGEALFRVYCARCHGDDALGDDLKAVPALAAQRRSYLVKQLADFEDSNRASERMHVVLERTRLENPQAWADLAAYLNALPPMQRLETPPTQVTRLGQSIFQHQCIACHGADAHGDEDGFIPSLRGQRYSYVIHELESLAANHRRNVDKDMVRYMQDLTAPERVALADYLTRLSGPVMDRRRMRGNGKVGD